MFSLSIRGKCLTLTQVSKVYIKRSTSTSKEIMTVIQSSLKSNRSPKAVILTFFSLPWKLKYLKQRWSWKTVASILNWKQGTGLAETVYRQGHFLLFFFFAALSHHMDLKEKNNRTRFKDKNYADTFDTEANTSFQWSNSGLLFFCHKPFYGYFSSKYACLFFWRRQNLTCAGRRSYKRTRSVQLLKGKRSEVYFTN